MRTHVGQYRIEDVIGRGGMGVVYRGVHENLGRQVAIKALAPELTQQPEFRERFFAEAKTQARLQHPNIVGVYDLIEEGGEYFIVMELAVGEGLDDRMRAQTEGQPMELAEALGIFGQMLSALDYAHSEGVIHRDVKPSNVILTAGGRVKLTDFGIALLIGDKRLTASQSAIGTPIYMSPEQIVLPRSVDHRTDIYSAAVVLFEMLAGRPPFDDETEYGIKKLHVEAPVPDLGSLRSGLPSGVVAAVASALEKDPEARFASSGAFLRALQEAHPLVGAAQTPAYPTPTYRPTVIEPTSPRTAGPTVPPHLPALETGRVLPAQGNATPRKWLIPALAGGLVLLVGVGALIFALIRKAPTPAEPAAQTAQVATPAVLPASPQSASPELPGPVTEPLVAQDPTHQASPPTVERTPVESGRNSQPAPRLPRAKGQGAPPLSASAPPEEKAPAPVPTPSPVIAAPAPASEPENAEPENAGLDRFTKMDETIVNIERLSKQVLDAYEDSDLGGSIGDRLDSFAGAAKDLRKTFRRVTGTGIGGIKENLRGIFSRNRTGKEGETKALEVQARELVRKGEEIDRLAGSDPLGPAATEYWQDVRRQLKRLNGYF